MLTPRSVFILLVLAQLVAFSLGEIAGSLRGAVILPLWRLLITPDPVIMVGRMDVGAVIGTTVLTLISLVIGVITLALLVRFGWPWFARILRLENTNP